MKRGRFYSFNVPFETPTTTTTETLAGGALHVYTLRTTDTIARLEISITHPTTEYVIRMDPIIVPVTEGAVTTIGKGGNLDAFVLFDVDKADLTPAALDVIDKAVAKIKEAEKTGIKKELTVVGHTDSVDEDAYNLELSKRRAEAVATALKTALPGWQITTDGKGETQPIASNDTDEGKALNRRVEIAWSK